MAYPPTLRRVLNPNQVFHVDPETNRRTHMAVGAAITRTEEALRLVKVIGAATHTPAPGQAELEQTLMQLRSARKKLPKLTERSSK